MSTLTPRDLPETAEPGPPRPSLAQASCVPVCACMRACVCSRMCSVYVCVCLFVSSSHVCICVFCHSSVLWQGLLPAATWVHAVGGSATLITKGQAGGCEDRQEEEIQFAGRPPLPLFLSKLTEQIFYCNLLVVALWLDTNQNVIKTH